MRIKPIAAVICLFIVSHLALGATYDLPDDQSLNSPDFGLALTPDGESGSLFYDQAFSNTQTLSNELKKDYLEVVKLLKNKQFKAAENTIINLIQQNPREADFYCLQATLQFLIKKPHLVIKSYQKAIELNPNNLKAQLGIATSFLQTGLISEAKQHANNALSIDKKTVQTYILLSEIANLENAPQDAENFLLTAQKLAKGNQQKNLLAKKLAKHYILQKQPKKVLVLAERLANQHPDDNTALALLASAQIYNNKSVAAILSLKKLIHLESKNTRYRLLLARQLAKQPGNEKKVLSLLDEISTIAPENKQLEFQKTALLVQLKLFPEAFDSAKKIRQLAPDSGLAELVEGNIYLADHKKEPALVAFQKSYELNANNKVLNIITNILVSQGNQSAAIDFLNRELKKNVKNLTAHFKLGNIYHQQNKIGEAEKHYQAILAEQPDNVVILNNLAWIYHQQNNPKSLALAERAYKNAPKSATVADTYAAILVKQGDLVNGLKIFERAGKLAPQNYDIQYHLADAYSLSGQHKQSISILKTITRSEQNFSEKDASISLLKKFE